MQAIATARIMSAQDLGSTTGIYQPQLGQQGPPGEAASTVYQQRQQGQIGQFHYLDNLRRSVRRVGQILVELFPKLYDGRRVLRILGPDESLKQVVLNEAYIDPQTGKPTLYDLSTGRYDVVVEAKARLCDAKTGSRCRTHDADASHARGDEQHRRYSGQKYGHSRGKCPG